MSIDNVIVLCALSRGKPVMCLVAIEESVNVCSLLPAIA